MIRYVLRHPDGRYWSRTHNGVDAVSPLDRFNIIALLAEKEQIR